MIENQPNQSLKTRMLIRLFDRNPKQVELKNYRFWEINGRFFEIFERDVIVVVHWGKWEHMATFLLKTNVTS